MAISHVYASLIIDGRKTFKQVPKIVREEVRAILVDLGYANLVED